jgi:hypothetical protein
METLMTPEGPPSEPALLASSLAVPEHVVYRDFVSETVVLNLQTGKYHGLNRMGGRILDELERTPTVGDVVGRLVTEYDRPEAEVEAHVLAFCSDLLARGLVEIRTNGNR